MEYNVQHISSEYNFIIKGVSYIGDPKPNTAMYVSKKVSYLLENLKNVQECLVFVEDGTEVPDQAKQTNCFIYSGNPQLTYAKFVDCFVEEQYIRDKAKKYRLTNEGYYLGENVQLGHDSYIEPGCIIGHDVVIGSNARIYAGSVIKNAVIGDNVLINENAVVGASGFTMTTDEGGNLIRIPTLGKVYIGNGVEIGAHDNISCGSSGNTVIEDYVKLDALVYVGHDAYIGKNVEITACSVIGGFDRLGCHSYVGLNASVRNRIDLGNYSVIGMGSTVTKSVEAGTTVVGNPAKVFVKK